MEGAKGDNKFCLLAAAVSINSTSTDMIGNSNNNNCKTNIRKTINCSS